MSLNPWLISPFTDLTGGMVNAQTNPQLQCAKLEMKLNDCLEAYGIDAGQVRCKDLFDDFKECSQINIQVERVRLMRMERLRQYKAGERKELYDSPPPLDAI